MLEACRRVPIIKRIVLASSDKAYGEQEKLPYEETAPLKGSHHMMYRRVALTSWHTPTTRPINSRFVSPDAVIYTDLVI